MERIILCPTHNRKTNYICLSAICSKRGKNICVTCVKQDHKICSDEEILDLRTFHKAADRKITSDLANKGGNSKKKLNQLFIDVNLITKERTDQKKKQEDIEIFENKLNKYIKLGLREMQEQVFDLQKQAVRENIQIESMSLEKIDYIKKKCHIKLNRENKTLELKFKNSNKIQEYLVLNKFLKYDFDAKFAASRDRLMKFKNEISLPLFNNYITTPFLVSKYNEEAKYLQISSLKNSHWRNKKGRFNQMVLLTKPIESVLFEIHLENLNLNSANVEILFLNKYSFDFWNKRVKFNKEEDYQDVPSIAKVDFDLRKTHEVSEFCKENKEIRSFEMSINGCRRLIEKCSFICNLEQKSSLFHMWKLNSDLLKKIDLRETTNDNNIAVRNKLSVLDIDEVKSENTENEDDWEDLTDSSTENELEDDNLNTENTIEMKKFIEKDSLFIGFLIHNEHVKMNIRFHEFKEEPDLN